MNKILVLSGLPGTGKTTLAENLYEYAEFCSNVSSSQVIRVIADRAGITIASREDLIQLGEKLDKESNGRWLAKEVKGMLARKKFCIIDRVRKMMHLAAFRVEFGVDIFHVHLIGENEVLENRYNSRDRNDGMPWISAATADAEEKALRREANLVVDTTVCDERDVFTIVAAHVGLGLNNKEKLVDTIIGGQYGSEGKGHIASYIASEYDVLVRSGGPNAGHQVYGNPTVCFHHLPSGMGRNTHAKIYLGAGAVINMEMLEEEIHSCGVDHRRVVIDENATIIERDDIEKEQELQKQMGSTAQGVGRAMSRRILRTSAQPPVRLAKDVAPALGWQVGDTKELLDRDFQKGLKVLVEGTQGSGLSIFHGPYPHTTSRDTNVSGLLGEIGIPPNMVRKSIMVLRTFPIRVQSPKGATSGPMAKEVDWETVSETSGVDADVLREKELTSTTKRLRRVSHMDWTMVRRAALLNGPTDVALTFLDYLSPENAGVTRFEYLQPGTQAFIRNVEKVTNAPVSFVSTGFNYNSIIDMRKW